MWIYLIIASIIAIILGLLLKKKKSTPIVTDIVIYPIKSCGSIHLESVQIDDFGMLYDRNWVLLTPDNNIVTQREDTLLLKLQPKLNIKINTLVSVELTHDGKKIEFEPQKIGEIIEFECMKVKCEGIDEGSRVSSYLEEVFKKPYRLVRVIKHRQISAHPRYQSLVADNHYTNFTDCAQFLVISEESYMKTKESLPSSKKDLEIGCFRGNIIVKGISPFEEDTWARFTIGDIEFEGIGRCPRCKVTTVHQEKLSYDDHFEPVATLRKINGNGTKGYLGMHCVRHNTGEIQVGQRVIVKATRKFPDI